MVGFGHGLTGQGVPRLGRVWPGKDLQGDVGHGDVGHGCV